MSTEGYLRTLDSEQLQYAINVAQALLAEKQAEPQRLVWRVKDNNHVMGLYAYEDYGKAVNHISSIASSNVDLLGKVLDQELRFGLDFMLVPESEYHPKELD